MHARRSALTFTRLSCAQRHQVADRDGVSILLSAGLDRRFTTPYRATEYEFSELDLQLQRVPRLDSVAA